MPAYGGRDSPRKPVSVTVTETLPEGQRVARPRKHTSEEERQRAHAASQAGHRRRQAAALAELAAAVEAAAEAGDPVARRCRTAPADALLRNLARYFREAADHSSEETTE
jgi:hypothetical protein